MSYILDALKKSEQERGHGNIPGVQTVHSSSLNYRNEKNSYWPYILITAIMLNIAVIIYFIFDREQPTTYLDKTSEETVINNKDEENMAANNSTIDTAATKIKENIADTVKSSPEVTHSAEAETITVPATKNNSAENIAEAKNTGVKKNNIKVIDFYNLPESIKQQLPTITISAHVYSSNPLQRSIVINNNFMEEGEYVLDNLILHEITPNGAIFDHNGTRFSYPVVSSWQ